MSITTNGYVTLTKENGIGVIAFFHPQSNSLPGVILSDLAATIQIAGQDNDIKVIILQSAGEKAFCAGASFDELIAIEDEQTGLQFFSGFANVINACRTAPKFIIGRVQGKAVGGGVGVAAATDYCFATQKSDIKLSELAVGIGPFVVGPAVERKVGLSAFSQMSVNATAFYSANWAKEKGLYAEVYENIDVMDTAIDAFVQTLIQHNSATLRQLKKVFWEGTEHWETLLLERAMMSGRLVLSEHTRAAIAEIKQKD